MKDVYGYILSVGHEYAELTGYAPPLETVDVRLQVDLSPQKLVQLK